MYALECHTRLSLLCRRNGSSSARFLLSSRPSAGIQDEAKGKRKKLRILALHGYGQRGDTFRKKSGALRKQVKSIADFVFIDAFLKAPLREDAKNRDVDADGGLGWWRWMPDSQTVAGWRESVAQINKCVLTQGPFDGIMGFSQGASITGLALHSLKQDSIAFVCLVGGFIPRSEEQARLLLENAPYNCEVWTSYGLADEIIPSEKSIELHNTIVGSQNLNCSGISGSVLISHSGGHLCSSEKATRQSFKEFLERQLERKALSA